VVVVAVEVSYELVGIAAAVVLSVEVVFVVFVELLVLVVAVVLS
jgi:hypothetical protein